MGHHLNKYISPSLKGRFVPGLVEIGLVVLEKKTKMLKVYDDNYDDNNGKQTFQSEKYNGNIFIMLTNKENRLE